MILFPTWQLMSASGFLATLMSFPKDSINGETVELLAPYLEMEDYNLQSAKKVGIMDLLQYWSHLSGNRDYHYKDKMVSRPSYPYNGNPYIGTKASSYWDGPRSPFQYRIRCLIVRYFFLLSLKAMRSWFTVFWLLYTGACKSQSNNSNSPNPSSSSSVVSNYKNAQEAMFLHSITKARVQVKIVLQKLIGQCL